MGESIDNCVFTSVCTEIPFSFQRNSTIGCGGYAAVGYYPKTEDELISVLNACQEEKAPFAVVGNMSNILPTDGFYDKRIISTKKFSTITFHEKGAYVSAGCSAGKLLSLCKTNGKTGAEFLTGIPCSVGGAAYMNAGVVGAYIADIIAAVRVWDSGKVYALTPQNCQYAYKSSVFMQDKYVILGVDLLLQNATETAIEEKLQYYSARRAHLPKGKSMGCVFKNPNRESAGKWIEKAGLKGLRRGGAVVSNEHANFIINDGGATATEITELITIIKNAVFAQYGVQLEEEIRYLY